MRARFGAEDPALLATATAFFQRYQTYIEARGQTLCYGLDCYLKLVARMVQERMEFLRTGKYASNSFVDVEQQIYMNADVFEYHMHGLVFAQFLWPEQATRFKFFSQHIAKHLAESDSYLEIGGGHALYILETVRHAPATTNFSLIDISPSSMELAKGIVGDLPIDFRLLNIFDYAPGTTFDFITMGEVIEHVEDPLSLLRRVRELLAPGGHAFISTPANSATIDHIYLFNSADEIREMFLEAGFAIVAEKIEFADNISPERAAKLKSAVMYAAFVKSAS